MPHVREEPLRDFSMHTYHEDLPMVLRQPLQGAVRGAPQTFRSHVAGQPGGQSQQTKQTVRAVGEVEPGAQRGTFAKPDHRACCLRVQRDLEEEHHRLLELYTARHHTCAMRAHQARRYAPSAGARGAAAPGRPCGIILRKRVVGLWSELPTGEASQGRAGGSGHAVRRCGCQWAARDRGGRRGRRGTSLRSARDELPLRSFFSFSGVSF